MKMLNQQSFQIVHTIFCQIGIRMNQRSFLVLSQPDGFGLGEGGDFQ
jgi:hypothetical protein